MVTRGSCEDRSAPSLYHEIAGQGNTLFVTCERKTLHFHYCKDIPFLFKWCENSQFENIHLSTISEPSLSLFNNAKTFTFHQSKNLLLSSSVKTFTIQQCENFHNPAMWKLSLSNYVKTFTFQQCENFHFQTMWKLSLSNNVRLSPCNSAWASFQPPPSWSGQFSAPEQSLQEINSDMLSDSNSLTLITFDSLTLAGYSLKEVDQERFGRTLHYWRGWQCPPYC